MTQNMKVSIILCTWNRSKSLRAVLDDLQTLTVPPGVEWEVLIVDNNSSDDTQAVCRTYVQMDPAKFRYFFEARQGKSFALNTGLENASGDIIAFTDDDVHFDKNWLSEIIKAFAKFDCAGFGGRIVAEWKSKKPAWYVTAGPYRHAAFGAITQFDHGDEPFVLNTAPFGANMVFHKSAVQKNGFFRTDLGSTQSSARIVLAEDTEYCRRLMQANEKIFYLPSAVVYHPVEEYRLKKKYLEAWSFHRGQSFVRVDRVPENAVCYFGIPRYFLPHALKYLLLWVSSLTPKRRFFYKLELCHTLGQMMESRNVILKRQPETAERTI